MKKFIGIGLISAALLAGCGGSPASTNGGSTDGTGASATSAATTGGDSVSTIPTSETGAGEAADVAPDATAAANQTAVTGTDAMPADATAQATPEAASNTGDTPGASGTTTDNNGTAGSGNTTTSESTTGGATGSDSATTGGATGTDASGSTSGSSSATTGAYEPAGVPELGLSFQIPQGWEQVDGENAWSPAGVEVPRIGVESTDMTADWKPSSMLPQGATVRSSQQVTLGGVQAMFYTVENTDGTAETHAIMRSSGKAYDFYARAESMQELQTIQPVLNDIVGSVQLSGV